MFFGGQHNKQTGAANQTIHLSRRIVSFGNMRLFAAARDLGVIQPSLMNRKK